MKITEIEVTRQLESLVPSGPVLHPENETQRVLRKALELLGPNGERWHQGSCHTDGCEQMCAGWAVRAVLGVDWRETNRMAWVAHESHPSLLALDRACPQYGSYITFNDKAASFSEVRAMFERAITLAAS